MSYKFDSLIIILNKLDAGDRLTVQSLMDDLEVSERTVHRYLKTLQVAGFPVNYDRAKGIYVFDEGYTLKKPNLTLEESLAFAVAKRVLGNYGSGVEKGLNSIEDKLSKKKMALPQHIILSADKPPMETERYLNLLNLAIVNSQTLELNYKGLHLNKEIHRKIDPYYLFFSEGFWYLRGYCHGSEEMRTFALDRIISIKALNEHFLQKGLSPEEELSASFGTWLDGEKYDVLLLFDEDIKPHVLRKKWHQSQQVKELSDGKLEMRFTVNGLKGIKKWIYQWLPSVEVLKPKELRDMLKRELKKTLTKHT